MPGLLFGMIINLAILEQSLARADIWCRWGRLSIIIFKVGSGR